MQQRGWEAYAGKLGVELMQSTQECLDWICTQVKGDYVLDADCGQAAVLMLLAREGKTVVGLNTDAETFAQARAFIAEESSQVQHSIDLRYESLLASHALIDQSFDTIILPQSLAFAERPDDHIEIAFSKLKPGGCLIALWPFGALSPSSNGYNLREPKNRLARHFETTQVRLFGEVLAIVCEPRSKVLEQIPTFPVWSDELIQVAESALTCSRVTSSSQLANAQRELRELKRERSSSSARMNELNEIQAPPQAATLTAQLDSIQSAKRLARDDQIRAATAKQMQAYQRRLIETEDRLKDTAAKLTSAQVKGRQFLEQFRGSQALEREALVKIRHLERRLRTVELQKAQALQQVEQTRKTLSFQLGYALLHAFKSWSSFIGLPRELVRIHKEGKVRRQRKLLKQAVTSHTASSARQRAARPPVKNSPQTAVTAHPELLTKDRLKVAGIMDEFTFHSYAPECELLQLRPESWRAQLDGFKPDLVFVESAWKGDGDSWKGIISNCTEAISDLLTYCKSEGIPSIFWNKEDPVHFSTFITVASLADHVFTTDVDCLPKYKAALGHDRVSLLPFAAQPKTHNPIEKFERKDAFNFAGSYYLRYPERQRDFAALIDTVASLKPVEIYDRNFDNPHPHYEFPEKYAPMILGSLPFSEIDRAYKGYRYGVNMNTIKQSQSMFARRVFELLASNTVVVSNFSRGVRVMFGDLVICSDNAGHISDKLRPICTDELTFRKFRLQGLRKVMSQHTYRQRLNYIKATLAKTHFRERQRSILILAFADTKQELDRIIGSFRAQNHAEKSLHIVTQVATSGNSKDNLQIHPNRESLISTLRTEFRSFELIGRMSTSSYYGENYLTDMALACEYSDAPAFTKAAHYTYDQFKTLRLRNDGQQYRNSSSADIDCSLFRSASLTSTQLDALTDGTQKVISTETLAIDEFNYCSVPSNFELEISARTVCADMEIKNAGASFHDDLIPISERIRATRLSTGSSTASLPKLSGEQLRAVFPQPSSQKISLSLKDGRLCIQSNLPPEKFAYIYATKIFNRDELNLVLNSHFHVLTSDSHEVKSVFEFQDANGKKIAHQMNLIGGAHTLAIPPNCEKIRIGFRIQGQNKVAIESIVFGSNGEPPATIASRSEYLILTKQYPSYEDLYRYGFLHSRVRSYKDAGLNVDVFRLVGEQEPPYREFEDIDVASGDLELLDQTLASGQYKKVLVHLLDEKMWSVLEKHLENIKVDIWIHGAEIQVWQRRSFEFERMAKEEITRQKKLSDKRVKFWRRVLAQPLPHKNVHLIFVSQYFAEEVIQDLGLKLPAKSYSIIHNYIDTNIFNYQTKAARLRKKILSIRPYASRKYANDLTISCILELARRPIFSNLEFNLYGDGDLFEETTYPVRHFDNVHCHRQFLSQKEISAIHKEHGVFMTPTRMDAQGVSRDEAMSSGLVSITNAVAAIPEFVDDECGYVVPAEDFVAMADAIEEMYNDTSIFSRKSAAGSMRVQRQCGYAATINKEIKLIRFH